jgi:nucleoid-associated protein YgaU
MRWLFRKRVERFEPPPRVEPKPPEEPTAAEEAVQAATFQADSIRETINLLESDLGAMIGDVQRACVFVCDRAEDSAAASDKIVQRSDTLVVRRQRQPRPHPTRCIH